MVYSMSMTNAGKLLAHTENFLFGQAMNASIKSIFEP